MRRECETGKMNEWRMSTSGEEVGGSKMRLRRGVKSPVDTDARHGRSHDPVIEYECFADAGDGGATLESS